MKRKGNVPTIMLVIVALVLTTATLLAFIGSDKNFGNQSRELSEITSEVDFNYNYILKTAELIGEDAIKSGGDVRENFIEIAGKRDLRIEDMGNFFGKIRNDEFKFDKLGEGYVLEVDGLFVSAQKSESKQDRIKRNFSIKMEFDKDGKLIKSPAQGL